MRKIGLIGFGAIGDAILRAWPSEFKQHFSISAILVRRDRVSDVARLSNIFVTSDVAEFLDQRLDCAVEAAGHAAVADLAERLLIRQLDLHILSVGALADDALRNRLEKLVRAGNGRILLPAGALAGFDGLASLREDGLSEVKYTVVKPFGAWRGTNAESLLLHAKNERQTIFRGSAREAASLFPRNANLAASVALAGIGFDETVVELIADDAAAGNTGMVEARSASSRLCVEVSGTGFETNPKSSRITALSVIAGLRNGCQPIRFV